MCTCRWRERIFLFLTHNQKPKKKKFCLSQLSTIICKLKPIAFRVNEIVFRIYDLATKWPPSGCCPITLELYDTGIRIKTVFHDFRFSSFLLSEIHIWYGSLSLSHSRALPPLSPDVVYYLKREKTKTCLFWTVKANFWTVKVYIINAQVLIMSQRRPSSFIVILANGWNELPISE